MNSTCLLIRSALLILSFLVVTPASGQLTFNFFDTAGNPAAGNVAPDVLAGFQAAGQRWSGIFTDNISVNLEVDFASIASASGPQAILGQTNATFVDSGADPGSTFSGFATFSLLKNQLALDQTSANDAIAVNNLPVGNPTTGSSAVSEALSFVTNDRAGNTFLDDDTSLGGGDFSAINNSLFSITSANAKALGLVNANSPGIDAAITINSTINFDFDPSNGIAAGATDFVGVATHEIGHALGFTSGVDTVDVFSGAGPSSGDDINGLVVGLGEFDLIPLFSTLDLFRRSQSAFALDPDALDLSTNSNSDVFFSIDGVLGDGDDILLETGQFNGRVGVDGTANQASHFRDSLLTQTPLGILDPTVAPGELLTISQNDILAFDVIGFDLAVESVPEPSAAMGLVAVGFALVTGRRRRF